MIIFHFCSRCIHALEYVLLVCHSAAQNTVNPTNQTISFILPCAALAVKVFGISN
jgi:hypothetical protein